MGHMGYWNGLWVDPTPGTASMSQLPGLERLLQALAAGSRLPRTGDPGGNRVFSCNIGMRTEVKQGSYLYGPKETTSASTHVFCVFCVLIFPPVLGEQRA